MMEERDQTKPEGGASGQARRCRVCRAELGDDAPEFPFCSKRCRMADLGRWFSGDYRISREIKDSDLETVD